MNKQTIVIMTGQRWKFYIPGILVIITAPLMKFHKDNDWLFYLTFITAMTVSWLLQSVRCPRCFKPFGFHFLRNSNFRNFIYDYYHCTRCPNCNLTIIDLRNKFRNNYDLTQLKNLIENVIRAKISLREFKFEHTSLKFSGEKYSQIYEDLEKGIQHTPSKFLSTKIDMKIWENQYEYYLALVHLRLLELEISDSEWFQLRRQLIDEYVRNPSADFETIIDQTLYSKLNLKKEKI